MRVLGLLMVRNGASRLQSTLDSMSAYCDAIYALDDRSTDSTAEILQRHALVENVFHVDPRLSEQPWFFSESLCLDVLYRCADLYRPDWLVCLDHDQELEPAGSVRGLLETREPGVAGILVRCVSEWRDDEYPDMIPVMGSGESVRGLIWRYYPKLLSGTRPLHTGRLPLNLGAFGLTVFVDGLACVHHGWSTLRERIDTVLRYKARDPRCDWNDGVPYDRALLFGYALDEIDRLIADFRRRAGRQPPARAQSAPALVRGGLGFVPVGSRW